MVYLEFKLRKMVCLEFELRNDVRLVLYLRELARQVRKVLCQERTVLCHTLV